MVHSAAKPYPDRPRSLDVVICMLTAGVAHDVVNRLSWLWNCLCCGCVPWRRHYCYCGGAISAIDTQRSEVDIVFMGAKTLSSETDSAEAEPVLNATFAVVVAAVRDVVALLFFNSSNVG